MSHAQTLQSQIRCLNMYDMKNKVRLLWIIKRRNQMSCCSGMCLGCAKWEGGGLVGLG